jgi:hypothetical protein
MVPVFSGGARLVAACLLILGPLLQVVEFLLEYTPQTDPTSRVAFWAAEPARVELGMTAGLLAVPFLLYRTGVFVALTRQASKRLAWAGIVALSIAVWRSPLLPRTVAPFLIAFAVLDFALSGYGVLSHIVNLVGFSIAAWAVAIGFSRFPSAAGRGATKCEPGDRSVVLTVQTPPAEDQPPSSPRAPGLSASMATR